MLFSLKDIQKFSLHTPDGDLGQAKTFLIDTADWIVRYVLVDIEDRTAPLSTIRGLGRPDFTNHIIPVNITLDRILNSPQIDMSQPFMRETERQISDYYEWPYYWDPNDVPNTLPGDLTAIPLIDMELDREEQVQEEMTEAKGMGELIPETGASEYQTQLSSLYSFRDLLGKTIYATNDRQDAGKVDDVVVFDENWKIPYLSVDTGGLLSAGKKVLLAPTYVQRVGRSRIDVNLRSETIKDSPTYSTLESLTDEFQAQLRQYYGQ